MNKLAKFAFLFVIGGLSLSSLAQTGNVAEEGIAKYYAKNLNGRVTSYGETYDDTQLTASHSKYPLNTILKVTNLENMKSVEVRVNDYCRCEEEGKLINLSREAATRLGMIASGKAYVRVEFVSKNGVSPSSVPVASNPTAHNNLTTVPASSPLPATSNAMPPRDMVASNDNNKVAAVAPVRTSYAATATTSATPSVYSDRSLAFLPDRTYDINGGEKFPKGFGVQLTALMNLNKVQDVYDELIRTGVSRDQIFIQVSLKDVGKVYRLLLGEFPTREAAEAKKVALEQQGYRGMIRAHYNL